MRIQTFSAALLVLFCCLSVHPAGAGSEGGELFVERKCVRCHTVGRGRFVGPDLKGVFSRYTREKIRLWITNPSAVYQEEGRIPVNEGYPPMPVTNVSLSDAKKIEKYLFSLRNIPDETVGGGLFGGSVENRTTGKLASDIEVQLDSFIGDRQLSTRSAKTGKDGEFHFDGLLWSAAHRISILYGGVFYETAKMVFRPEQREIEVYLPIYETATDDSTIGVELNHMIVEPSGGGAVVAEFVEFVNRGNAAVVSAGEKEDSGTLRFGVPRGAVSTSFIHGVEPEKVSGKNGGFISLPVLPGLKRVVYSYLIPFQSGAFGSGRASFAKNLEYAASSFTVMSPAGAGVSVEGLGDGKRVSGEDGRVFFRWEGKNLAEGHEVKISVNSPGDKTPVWVMPAVTFTVVLLIAALLRRFASSSKK